MILLAIVPRRYVNRQPWWGDSSKWHNVDISLDPADGSVLAHLPSALAGRTITAIKYGHISPKGSPQSGHDKLCCGNRDFSRDPCAPASCPISASTGGGGKGSDAAATDNYLPAMPFHAAIVGGECKCFAPQVCG